MKIREIIGQLKNQSTWRLFFLGVVTLGIYLAHYVKSQTKILNQHLDNESQISEGLVSFILIISYVSVLLLIPYIFVEDGRVYDALGNLLDLVWFLLMLYWAFAVRNRMNKLLLVTKKQPQWFHGFWTFSFYVFYINYKINTLNDNFAEQSVTLENDSESLQP